MRSVLRRIPDRPKVFLGAAIVLVLSALASLPGPAGSTAALETPEELLCRTPAAPFGDRGPVPALPPAKGTFLVATRNVTDPLFAESVVILIGYGSEGAAGLIINRPSEMKLADALPDIKVLQQKSKIIHVGGPVGRNQMRLLIRSAGQPGDSERVLEGVYLTSNRKELERLAARTGSQEEFRVYAGYAGWTAQQLEREIARGDWYVMPADAGNIFEKESSDVWPELFRRGSALWVRLQRPAQDG